MTGILKNTPNTKFDVQDAQTRAMANSGKSDKGWGSLLKNGGDLMNRFNQSVDNFGNRASQLWDNVRSLF